MRTFEQVAAKLEHAQLEHEAAVSDGNLSQALYHIGWVDALCWLSREEGRDVG